MKEFYLNGVDMIPYLVSWRKQTFTERRLNFNYLIDIKGRSALISPTSIVYLNTGEFGVYGLFVHQLIKENRHWLICRLVGNRYITLKIDFK